MGARGEQGHGGVLVEAGAGAPHARVEPQRGVVEARARVAGDHGVPGDEVSAGHFVEHLLGVGDGAARGVAAEQVCAHDDIGREPGADDGRVRPAGAARPEEEGEGRGGAPGRDAHGDVADDERGGGRGRGRACASLGIQMDPSRSGLILPRSAKKINLYALFSIALFATFKI